MRLARPALIPVLAVALAGCLQSHTVVKMNPDGSGTIEETVLMSDQMIAMMSAFAPPAQSLDASPTAEGKDPAEAGPAGAMSEMFSEKKAKERAAKMGEGVTFVSSEKVKAEGFQGMKAIYAFTDITKLKLGMKPNMPGPTPGPPEADEAADRLQVRFAKSADGNSALTLVFKDKPAKDAKSGDDKDADDKAGKKKGAEAEDPAQAAQLEQMKQMFKGMKFSLAVEVGKLVKSSSPYVEGNRVTVFDIDFEALMANPGKFKEMTTKNPQTLAEVQELMKDVKGIKFPLEPEISIEFAGK